MSMDLSGHVVMVVGTADVVARDISRRLTEAGARTVDARPDVSVLEQIDDVVLRHGRLDAVVGVAGAVDDLDRLREVSSARSHRAVITVLVTDEHTDVVADSLARHVQRTRVIGGVAPRVNAVCGPVRSLSAVADVVAVLLSPATSQISGQVVTVTGSLPEAPENQSVDEDAVVVVGMGLAVPGASSPAAFWDLLRGDEPVFREPGGRYDLDTMWSDDPAAEDRTYARVAGFMYGFEPHPRLRQEIAAGTFDSDEFTALWLRHSLLQATDGVTIRHDDRQFFAAGLTPDGSQHLEQSLVADGIRGIFAESGAEVPAGLAELYPLASGTPEDLFPYRIARLAAHDLPDTAEIVVVDTACSSSLYAIDLGVRALRAGETDVALCGGALALQAQSLVLFSKLRGLSKSASVRALDSGADGVLFSDGAAVLALKTHARAIADRDPILGFVAGFGGSSDGRGKAIYAPNAAGQRIALDRAWSGAGVAAEDIDWIVAHATGTPTGDKTEMTALTQNGGAGKKWTMTSNKSLVGHSGWAAGAVSVVHALLAMGHESIPAQRRFTTVPSGFEDSIMVPTVETPWPARADRGRVVGVSAMGFGGTNGHLLLSDAPRAGGSKDQAGKDPVVIVATAVHLPDDPDEHRVDRWLAGHAADWPETFGEKYPLPSPVEARLAPSALAAMDRGQLMAMRCGDMLAGDWVKDDQLSERTGVFVGHSGPTRAAMGYDLRCYLSDVTAKLTGPAGLAPEFVGDRVRAMVPESNEDSYPGLMPNVIAARIAQRLDLHGPNMTLDAGADSVNSALATAVRYVREGQLDLAIVMGVNTAMPYLASRDPRGKAEAAIGFVLTRLSTARTLGVEVLGTVSLTPSVGGRAATADAVRDHGGAEGAVALLRALRLPGARTVVSPVVDRHTPAFLVTAAGVERTEADPEVYTGQTPDAVAYPNLAGTSQRHTLVLRPRAGERINEPVSGIPANSLVLTDDPESLSGESIPPGCLIVVPASAPRAVRPTVPVVYLDDAEELARIVAEDGRGFGQVRVIVSGQRWDAAGDAVSRRALELNDLAFVAAQSCAEALDDGGCYAVLMLDVLDGNVPLPYAGVFNGLVRSLQQELSGCVVFSLGTDLSELGGGLAQLSEESGNHRFLPVVYRASRQRLEMMLLPARAPSANTSSGLPDSPVIVATGGARGLTTHLVRELVSGSSPRGLWLLGTAPEPDLVTAAAPLAPRADALRELMARYPGEKIGALNRRYERAAQEAERVRVIRELERLCGPGRVRYRQCDVLDEVAVRRVIDEVLDVDGTVDVLVHGAGLARTAMLANKKLADFRTVRDVKVRGYANLRAALGDRQPKLWASVSSVSAFTPLRGEFDYCAGNEFLLLAAAHSRRVRGYDEVALASGLWVESGMASADTPGGAFLARQAEIGQLTDEQGREFFRAELAGRGSHGLGTTWIGQFDWNTMERRAPGFHAACQGFAGTDPEAFRDTVPYPRRRAFLVRPPRLSGETDAEWTFEVDLGEHPYLLDHLVDGRPTIPGTFVLEMGAEAAAAVATGMIPARITDVVLSSFIRAPHHRWPRTLRVAASRIGDEVRVRVATPASGPVPEREHTRMTVHLAHSLPEGPWCPPAPAGGVDAPNTYELPGTAVELSGVFGSLRSPRLEPDGGSAWLHPTLPADGEPFSRFMIPSVALDCLLRTSVLDGREPDTIPALVPTAIASVDFYTMVNDVDVAGTWPSGLRLRHWHDPVSRQRHCAVVTPDGRALFRATGITGHNKSLFDVRTGQWRSAAVVPEGR
ncbi:MAG: SDR family oxidoreductase [Actinomycetota bacterium]|nr:SDR family oxidoreductase [Actinomycetota bacterium]